MSDYEGFAEQAMAAVMTDSVDKSGLYRVLDAMSTDDLHALYQHADSLAMHARREWLARTTRPRDHA